MRNLEMRGEKHLRRQKLLTKKYSHYSTLNIYFFNIFKVKLLK